MDFQEYSLVKLPSPGSKVVEEAKENIVGTGNVDFDMVDDLNVMAKCLQIAYNGLVSYPTLQGEVKDLQIKVLILYDESDATIRNFGRASNQILQMLEPTYDYLYKGQMRLAQEMFSQVSGIANDMASKAEKLQRKYEDEVTRTRSLLGKTYDKKQQEKNRKDQALKDKQETEVKLESLRVAKEEALEKFKVMEGLFYDAQRREHKAMKNQSDPFKRVMNTFVKICTGTDSDVFDMEVYKNAAEGYRRAKEKYFEEMERVRDLKREIKADLAEFAQRVKNCVSESELADIAIEALEDVSSGLHKVAVILQNAVRFWLNLHNGLDDMKRNRLLEMALGDFSEEERSELIHSETFKRPVMQNYCMWVATKAVCADFNQRYDLAREGLKGIIQERISERQSMIKAREAANELSSLLH